MSFIVWVAVSVLVMSLMLSAAGAAGPVGIFTDCADVGAPSSPGPGSAVFDARKQTYSISGGGANMWGAADAFHYVWKRVSGDVGLTASIEFVGASPQPHRKACLVFRQSLDPDSVYVDAAIHGDGLTSIQWRQTRGGPTREVQSHTAGPKRLRIEKRGNYCTLWIAGAGEELRAAAASPRIVLEGEFLAGLAVCAHDANRIETALFSDVELAPLPAASGPPTLLSVLETISIGSGDRRAVYVAPLGQLIEAPNWSADNFLYYNSNGRLYRIPAEVPGSPPSGGRTPEPIDTGLATRLNNDHGISPDGKLMAISDQTEEGRSLIYVVPIRGDAPRRLTPLGPSYFHGWSPDGRAVTYCGQRNGAFDIYTIDIAGGQERRLTSASGKNDGPEYSPDGRYIYFNSDRTGNMQIWRMRPDGSQQERITNDEANNWFPHISPDGRYMVFLSYEKGVKDHPANKDVALRLMDLQTMGVQTLTTLFGGQGTINVASWAPNSRALAFVSYQVLAR